MCHFKYLGVIISGDGNIDKELSARIQKSTGAFNLLSNIWKNRNIKRNTKIRIYKAAVLTILLYGCEVWNTTDKQMKRFEVFHQRCLRRILRIKWFQRITNKKVLEDAEVVPIKALVTSTRLRWFGHVPMMPNNRITKQMLDWKPNFGKRSRGRPKLGWLDCVREDGARMLKRKSITIKELTKATDDRDHWRELITRVRMFIGAGHSDD